MPTQLRIAMVNMMHGGTANAAAVADVMPIGRDRGTQLRGVVIPVAGSWSTVDVAPGRYLVSAMLPSGDVLDDEVTVAAGESKDVLLRGDETPHEWLGWHKFSPTRRDLWDTTRHAPTPVTARLVQSRAWLERVPHGGDVLAPAHSDGATTAFEIDDVPSASRWMLVVRRARRRDVVVLPAPWGVQHSTIQIATPDDADLPVSVAVQDPELGPLLGYVASGALGSATRLLRQDHEHWRDFIELLGNKYQNPFGAAVAAYVLFITSREREGSAPYWHKWIANLASGFPWIADGAVLTGWLALRNGDRDGARTWFGNAVTRGLPVVTGNLRLLHEGLLATGDDSALARISGTFAHADMSQPFVTLRFDEEV